MKKLIILSLIVLAVKVQAQNLMDFKNALNSRTKAVQAIHSFPQEFGLGCHWVEVSSISSSGDLVTFIERIRIHSKVLYTYLSGTVGGHMIKGTWKSDYGSGFWAYDLNTGNGRWDMTSSTGKTFESWQQLRFRIVERSALREQFGNCN